MARKTAAEKRAESEAREAREIHEALRWTGPASPDVMCPKGSEYTTGFLVVGSGRYARAEKAWSGASSHGWSDAYPVPGSGGSQGGRNLHSSKVAALRQARHERELDAAEQLRAIDKQIEAAMKETTHG